LAAAVLLSDKKKQQTKQLAAAMEPRQHRALTRSVSRERSRSGSPSAGAGAQQPVKRRCLRQCSRLAAEAALPAHRGGDASGALGGARAPACPRPRRAAPPLLHAEAPCDASGAHTSSSVSARRGRSQPLPALCVPLYDGGAAEALPADEDDGGARVEGWFERVRRASAHCAAGTRGQKNLGPSVACRPARR
jgi:hypothetical protein